MLRLHGWKCRKTCTALPIKIADTRDLMPIFFFSFAALVDLKRVRDFMDSFLSLLLLLLLPSLSSSLIAKLFFL